MRIHSLSFRGVGPYRDQQHIDFDQLGDSGLYLINGPTGAGKSTIIDCICFALYGRLASDDADASRMRSHFAGPNDPTEVDLVFETNAGTYRVIRTPAYRRAKLRGQGEAEERPSCKVFRIAPDGREESIATQVASANHELQQLLGLTREQFVQTVVLPQGQFAKFLYSNTSDREEILKRIFNTRLFERVVELLQADARQALQDKDAATAGIIARLRQLSALVDLPVEAMSTLEEAATNRLDDALREGLVTLRPGFEEAATAAQQAAAEATTAAQLTDRARDQAKTEADAQHKRTAAQADVVNATTAADEARTLVAAAAGLADSLSITTDDSDNVDVWRSRADLATAELGRLTALLATEQAVLAWPAEQQTAEQAIAQLRLQQEADKKRCDELPALIAAEEATAALRPTLDEMQRVNAQRETLTDVGDQLARIDQEAERLPQLAATVSADLEAAKVARAQADRENRRYHESIATVLADDLAPDEPCPVCGSLEHPHPATSTGAAVTFEEVEALREQAGRANAAVEASRTALESSRELIDELTATVTMTREELEAALAINAADERSLKEREVAATTAEDAASRLRTELQQVTERLGRWATQIATEQAALDAKVTQMSADAAVVAQARGNAPSIDTRVNEIRVLQSALTTLADRLATVDSARAGLATAERNLAALPDREGFADVEAANEAWQAADEARTQAVLAREATEGRLAHVVSAIADVDDLCDQRAHLIAESADLLDLAELFGAGHGSNVGLHVYVLQSWFANVMESANRRFESLLNGRYRLVRTPEDQGDGRSRQGLGVSVEDRLTGTVRPAKSLSGGETFCASLALALGLSDVVRMIAGGIEINSMFIDEGFGSLDNEQLDEVMLMLGHLSRDGRRVGVISHVDSMKSAITERIDVTPAGDHRPTSLQVSWMS